VILLNLVVTYLMLLCEGLMVTLKKFCGAFFTMSLNEDQAENQELVFLW
jgi:hypothetical protein